VRSLIVLAVCLFVSPASFAQQAGSQAGQQPGTSAVTNYTPFPNGRAEWSITMTQDRAHALAEFFRQLESQRDSGTSPSAAGLLADSKTDYCVRCSGGGPTQDFQAYGDPAAAARALLICRGAYAVQAGRCTP
jgi:hypothetical protein